MNEFIRTTLYHRSQDSQRGVLLTVLNSIAQHELREALALFLLMRSHGVRRSAAAAAAMTAPTGAAADGGDSGRGRGGGGGSGSGGEASVRRTSSGSVSSSVTVAEAEQLTADFLEREFGALVNVRADEALERLCRLGLVRRDGGSEAPRSAEGAATSTGSGVGAKTALPPPDYESYTAVPIPEALAILRHMWGGEHHRAQPAATRHLARHHPPSLLQLTSAVTPGRRRTSRGPTSSRDEPHSPPTPFLPRDLSM
jgi:hypothetical protein